MDKIIHATEYAESQSLGNTCLLDGKTQDDRTGKDHQNIPIDGFHGLVDVATAEQQHGHGSKEGALQQWKYIECGEYNHRYHNAARDECLFANVGHLRGVEEV